MKLTPEQEICIRLLSEKELYHQAITFARSQEALTQDNTQCQNQLTGLLQFSRSWDELTSFVKHQRERDWQGKREVYKTFYTEIEKQLDGFIEMAKENTVLVPQGLSKKETRERATNAAAAMAGEFLQHLYAEMLQQMEGK